MIILSVVMGKRFLDKDALQHMCGENAYERTMAL